MKSLLRALSLCSTLLLAAPALGGDLQLKAGFGFSGEYNDNVRETATNARTDFITHIKPALSALYEGGRIRGELRYHGDYMFHVKGKDSDEYRHYLNALASAEIVENLFFLDLQDDLQPVYRSASLGPYVEGDTTMGMVNKNRFSVTPYFMLYPSERSTLRLGYSFADVRYSKPYGNGSGGSPAPWDSDYSFSENASMQHSVFTDVTHELTDRLSFFTGGSFLKWDSETNTYDRDTSFTRWQAYAGGQYEPAEDIVVYARGGPTRTKYKEGNASLSPYVDAGIKAAIGRSLLSLTYTMDFIDDPETGENLRHSAIEGSWAKEFLRSRLRASLGYHTYKGDTQDDDRDDSSYRPSLSYTYDLSERLSAFVRGDADIPRNSSRYGDRYYASTGLKYQLSEKHSIGLSYGFKRSEGVGSSRAYNVNRITVDFSVNF